ncbi:MAG: acyl-CoA desaturase [Bacteroidia bacterium]
MIIFIRIFPVSIINRAHAHFSLLDCRQGLFVFSLNMKRKVAKFPKHIDTDFISVLRARVKDYFETNNISRYGDGGMVFKTIFMVALYFVPYLLMLVLPVSSPWLVFGAYCIMGFGVAGIGLSIMHDANHGAYSQNKVVNRMLGSLLDLVGGASITWRIQHNVLHHTYTNIDGLDEDIAPIKILRFSPHQERYGIHRFQHLYAWFFYGLMTFSWITVKDFSQLMRYEKMGLTKSEQKPFWLLFVRMLAFKVFYYGYVLVLPLVLMPQYWLVILLSFLTMHFIAGLMMASIFQPAHVVPDAVFPLPDSQGVMDNNWAIHQLLTTTNYAPKSRIFSWYVGGLNFQIEHHLFPNICHVHYKKISAIVRKTAQEFNLPYHSQPTFLAAVFNHAMMLRQLGRV